ncbi:MAG: transglycosylase domain-containing protein [Bacteroidales bacterium]|nr:transglycosylase domain-containing protein [Bacteroidales bacterium]
MKHLTRNIVIVLWVLFLIGIGVTYFLFKGIASGSIGYMPDIEELENPKSKYATIVYSCDSVEIGRFSQANENRVYVDYNSLSPYLVQALIATEDARFEEHSGIDIPSVYRAIFKTVILRQSSAGGGSTITQQLAKQLYTEKPSSGFWGRVMQKPVEWVIAVKLETLYTKEEIINMYLNKFDFCYNAIGIRSACYIYFGKTPKELNIEEAAMLVGMLQNPAYFNPIRRTEKTLTRRSVVMKQMQKANFLTEAQYDSLKLTPLLPNTTEEGKYRLAHSADHKAGMAPYLREYLRKIMRARKPDRSRYASWQNQQFVDDSIAWETDPLYGWCNKNHKFDGSTYSLTTDGLRIYTSLNSRMQQYAEESVIEQLRDNLQPEFTKEKKGQKNAPYSKSLTEKEVTQSLRRAMRQSERYNSMLSHGISREDIEKSFYEPVDMKVFSWQGEIDTIMTPYDSLRWQKQFLRAGFMCMDSLGYVKAYVGGPDFTFFQYDMVTAGRRQVGSTIKPLLYTLAMEEGRTPCDEELNSQPILYDANGRPWTPRDAGKERIGEMVTLQWGLMKSNNWISARVMSKLSPEAFVRMLHSMGIRNQLDPVLSLCLGVCDISVEEMVTAYSSFVGRGQRVSPLYVQSITDNNGIELARFTPRRKEVFSFDAYLKMLPILRDVIDHGTGTRIRFRYKITAPMAGKTGTTNDNSDGWFMAFTPSLVAGTWVGGEERSIAFDRMAYGQGASMALPIFANFIKKVYADPHLPYNEEEQFYYPEDYDPCANAIKATPVTEHDVESGFFD